MRAVVLTVASILLAACGSGSEAERDDADDAADAADDLGGMGVPQQFAAETFPGVRRAVEVRVHLADNGCFLGALADSPATGRQLVVWPAGTQQGSSGDQLELPDGTLVSDGDVLTGQGLLMPTRRLKGFGGDSFWDYAVGFCTPRATDVLVLDSAGPSSLGAAAG